MCCCRSLKRRPYEQTLWDSLPHDDFHGNDDVTASEASTPGTPNQQFQAKFAVKVSEPTKDGEIVLYTLDTLKTSTEATKTTRRQYEDFEYLHHCLMTEPAYAGLIIPPLPAQPVVQPKMAAEKSKQELGKSTKTLKGDEFHKDCRALQKFLSLICSHPTIGNSLVVENFLMNTEAPIRPNVRKGIFGRLWTAADSARKANHADIDDYFQKERDSVSKYARYSAEASDKFNEMVNSQQRIASVYGHLATTLVMGCGAQDPYSQQCNKIFFDFCEAVEDAKHGCEVDFINDENILGSHLDLYKRYSEAAKEMLYRRTCLLMDYEEANRVLSKAKPNKQQEVSKSPLVLLCAQRHIQGFVMESHIPFMPCFLNREFIMPQNSKLSCYTGPNFMDVVLFVYLGLKFGIAELKLWFDALLSGEWARKWSTSSAFAQSNILLAICGFSQMFLMKKLLSDELSLFVLLQLAFASMFLIIYKRGLFCVHPGISIK
ncbi:hypothetical protein CAPTEDRAFT_207998 [Capitella teleta]|uniref:PX domain-containing protein n=1 Tax=Capitella teleta TaxID=283909 RepID=R7TM72_CAPTE|nr:hypothetical protein CAPTEDRAFT_207998 [Capitella teleta]|eukprot:ELT94739.1 hypothetical protein CAPTEDRAFT_207998 [Capitella teleta]